MTWVSKEKEREEKDDPDWKERESSDRHRVSIGSSRVRDNVR